MPPSKGIRPSLQDVSQGPEVDGPALLPAAVRARRDRLISGRPNDRATEAGVGRVLVVQLREGLDAPPSLYGVQGLGPAGSEAVEEDWEGL